MNSELIIKFQKSKLDPYLSCSLCDGYFRLAHTVAECGHTFCKICIFNYLQTLRGGHYKCPLCGHSIENNYRKSIKKDPYKQSLVDTLYPHYAQKELMIIKKIKELFPDYDLQNIIEEYNFDNNKYTNAKYLKKRKTLQNDEKGLSEVIYEKLNIDFESFVNGINDEKKYNDFKARLKILENKKNSAEKIEIAIKIEPTPVASEPIKTLEKKESNPNLNENQIKNNNSENQIKDKATLNNIEQMDPNELMLSLHPKTEADFQIVQLKNVLKFKNVLEKPVPAEQLKKLIIKRVLDLAKQSQNSQNTLINIDKVSIDNVILYLNEKIIENESSLYEKRKEASKSNQSFIVYYEILFKR